MNKSCMRLCVPRLARWETWEEGNSHSLISKPSALVVLCYRLRRFLSNPSRFAVHACSPS